MAGTTKGKRKLSLVLPDALRSSPRTPEFESALHPKNVEGADQAQLGATNAELPLEDEDLVRFFGGRKKRAPEPHCSQRQEEDHRRANERKV